MEPHVKPKSPLTFLGFMDSLYVLMKTVWGEEAPLFTMVRPDGTDGRDIPMPQIVYNLQHRQPGVMGNNQTREIKPRVRSVEKEISPLTQQPVFVEYRGQMQDCTVAFTIYGATNEEAFYWTERFRFFLQEYKGFFLKEGVQNYWWKEEYGQDRNESGKTPLSSRSLVYTVRLEELIRSEQVTMDEIDVTASIMETRQQLESTGGLPSQKIHPAASPTQTAAP